MSKDLLEIKVYIPTFCVTFLCYTSYILSICIKLYSYNMVLIYIIALWDCGLKWFGGTYSRQIRRTFPVTGL